MELRFLVEWVQGTGLFPAQQGGIILLPPGGLETRRGSVAPGPEAADQGGECAGANDLVVRPGEYAVL